MIKYELSETIQADPAQVFRYLSDVGLYARWMNLESAEVVTPDTQGRGQRWRAKTREGMFLAENSEFESNRLVAYKTIEGPFDWTGGFRLDVEPNATRITSYGQIKLRGLQRLMEPLMTGKVRKGEAAELKALKGLIEG